MLALVIICADHLTDPYIQFPILFLIPVTFACVYNGRWWGVALAVVMPWTRFSSTLFVVPEVIKKEAINTVISMVVLAGFAILTARTVAQTAQMRVLRRKVKTLQGFLPICSFCKKIRKEDHTWEPIEKYVTERSAAEFSHGVCPDCVKIHYPSVSLVQKQHESMPLTRQNPPIPLPTSQ